MSPPPSRLVLLGRSLPHALSPRLQGAALRAAGLDVPYDALEVEPDALAPTLDALVRDGAGGNVTIPYKESVFARCAARTPLAQRTGAVNTFWVEDGGLHGDNTDAGGFDAAARALLGVVRDGMRVHLFGAGGAAAGVLGAIADWPGARVTVHNRTASRTAALVARFPSFARAADASTDVGSADVVVNATSVGLRDDDTVLDVAALAPHAVVIDVVYRRDADTALVRAARARGLRAGGGLEMLVEQGALAFERWFGFPPDRQAMWSAVR